MFDVTRRQAGRLVLGFAATGLVLGPLHAETGDFEARLQAGLASAEARLPGGTLTLLRFESKATDQGWHVAARVRMTWPPGLRQRGFAVQDADPEMAFTGLLASISEGFGTL